MFVLQYGVEVQGRHTEQILVHGLHPPHPVDGMMNSMDMLRNIPTHEMTFYINFFHMNKEKGAILFKSFWFLKNCYNSERYIITVL